MPSPFPTPDSGAPVTPAQLPLGVRAEMLVRLLAIQSAWNYETLLGNGIAFSMEPALELLPGGRGGAEYRAAMARQSRYFNAHPYLAAVAVGALARAELEHEAPARIERFRAALCGPLGSCGDRLVWAAWLPLCSLLGLAAWSLGAGPLFTVALFLFVYNLAHLGLRVWGLHVGLRLGLRVASALGAPWLRRSPEIVGQMSAALAGVTLPLVVTRVLPAQPVVLVPALVGIVVGTLLLVRVQGRWEGWRIALPLLALLVLYSVVV